MFLKGLRENGVPLKICSWHTNIGTLTGSTINFAVQERNRSIKSIFALQKRQNASFLVDNGASFFDTCADGIGTLQNFQFRVGARYFPASPCQTSVVGGSKSNGAAEAFVELQKALNTVGDYRLSTNTNAKNWAIQGCVVAGNTPGVVLPEFDFSLQAHVKDADGRYVCSQIESSASGFCGTLGSSCFAMASSFETSNGMEISGLNAEEQSDISVMAYWSKPQVNGAAGQTTNLEVYTFFDQMIVLRENNVVELIY
jgi:hypothetical protein